MRLSKLTPRLIRLRRKVTTVRFIATLTEVALDNVLAYLDSDGEEDRARHRDRMAETEAAILGRLREFLCGQIRGLAKFDRVLRAPPCETCDRSDECDESLSRQSYH